MSKTDNELALNPIFLTAIEMMENTRSHLFITGRAGTGKSKLLEYFCEHTNKKLAVLAPTGVAAINVDGQTIHSFFKFRPETTIDTIKKHIIGKQQSKIYQQLEIIIIDEISMVRADILDCINWVLGSSRQNLIQAFGGIKMVFISDLYQLPPVVKKQERKIFSSYYATPYFFSAKICENFKLKIIELTKVYRQKDLKYIELLNSVRNNSITEQELEHINSRYLPTFIPDSQDFYIYLAATNAQVTTINEEELSKINNKCYRFMAKITGDFSREYYPATTLLEVKIGAQVMMINNSFKSNWVNGSIGKIINIIKNKKTQKEIIVVKLDDGVKCYVEPYTWEINKLVLEDNQLNYVTIGKFEQYPLTLAWAVTIHKSQGKTFNKVIIDLSEAFSYGQSYVALSLCVNLECVVLKNRILKQHICFDPVILEFFHNNILQSAEGTIENKIKLIKEAIELQKNLSLEYQKLDKICKIIIKPLKIKVVTALNDAKIAVVGGYLEQNYYNKRLFF